MINLLIVDLQEIKRVGKQLLNSQKRLNNLDEYLDKIKRKRTYKPAFPLKLFIHKDIVDDISEPQEIVNYNKAVEDYNSELEQGLQLSNRYKALKNEIGMLVEELTLDDVEKLCLTTNIASEQAKEIYRTLKELPA
ncbi:hypothetical protein A3O11_01900 [Ligilactobacillus aviarius]|uniref:hypothetical protein n=1 Tax=Ligilactobacillus aviarius TaxID=1606 RepID=UPI0007D9484B|nr:hypothetical protein [Ligilactobacillus aviarius]OAQ05336.1 hypothetical protein A3O10_02810 [Ligilactobacillus aviarius]OAQ05839.1 hypothetical protein A3O11_01900 [Ligilactobacillus aviarius]OAS80690.1 hypothetical protein A3O18_03720 [Ligilactobacillus aviarius]PEG71100.1 hypothetical protein A3P04_02975 [Ligilactobacillus aviarius]PEG74225.1 hypothetical protein A3O82_02210 [Ligilactobacillus aviarius]